MTTTTPVITRRYSAPRRVVSWRANTRLRILKMLAYHVWYEERLGTSDLWKRVEALCPHVIEHVTGDEGVTLRAIVDATLAAQGAEITPTKLMQRADKAYRYDEFEPEHDAVFDAYQSYLAGKRA